MAVTKVKKRLPLFFIDDVHPIFGDETVSRIFCSCGILLSAKKLTPTPWKLVMPTMYPHDWDPVYPLEIEGGGGLPFRYSVSITHIHTQDLLRPMPQ